MGTSFIALTAFACGGLSGIIVMGSVAVRSRAGLLAEVQKWRGEFNRAIRDCANLAEQRDRLKHELKNESLRCDGLIREVDELREYADIGRRRQAALHKRNTKMKERRAAASGADVSSIKAAA